MLTIGIANALARGDTSDTCWKRPSIIGTMPSVIAHCACPAAGSQAHLPVAGRRPMPTYISNATAPAVTAPASMIGIM